MESNSWEKSGSRNRIQQHINKTAATDHKKKRYNPSIGSTHAGAATNYGEQKLIGQNN